MSKLLAGLALFGFVLAWVIAAIAWFATIVYGVKAARRARPDVNIWGAETWYNPGNVLVRPSLLTAEGRAYQRKCWLSAGIFVLCTGIPLLVAALTGHLE